MRRRFCFIKQISRRDKPPLPKGRWHRAAMTEGFTTPSKQRTDCCASFEGSQRQTNVILSAAKNPYSPKRIPGGISLPLEETPLLGEMLSEAKQRGLPSAASKRWHAEGVTDEVSTPSNQNRANNLYKISPPLRGPPPLDKGACSRRKKRTLRAKIPPPPSSTFPLLLRGGKNFPFSAFNFTL